MNQGLQVAHIVLFLILTCFSGADRRATITLTLSGVLYVILQHHLWPVFKPWPLGIFNHTAKMAIDLTVIWVISKTATSFALKQSFILWLMVGWNFIAAVEFPFLKYFSIVYDVYPMGAHFLNLMQLIVGTWYGLRIIGVVDWCRDNLHLLVSHRVAKIHRQRNTFERSKK